MSITYIIESSRNIHKIIKLLLLLLVFVLVFVLVLVLVFVFSGLYE